MSDALEAAVEVATLGANVAKRLSDEVERLKGELSTKESILDDALAMVENLEANVRAIDRANGVESLVLKDIEKIREVLRHD